MSPAQFGIRNPVPVNLIMAAILIAGIVAGLGLRREFFPESDPDTATLSMPYPGATPDEVEEALAIKVENALIDLDEIEELNTTLAEGGGAIGITFREGVRSDVALDEVERAVDALRDLPEEAEEITVTLLEPRLPVIRVAVFGPLDEPVMKDLIRGVRDELQTLPDMGEVLIDGVRDYELSVEVRGDALAAHGLSLPEIAAAVRAAMSETPGGTVKGAAGNVKVRTVGVPERAEAVRGIVLRSDVDGRALTVGDVAEVTAGFVEDRVVNRFNREPAAVLTVFKVGAQDIVDMANKVRRYVDGRRGEAFAGSGAAQRQAWELGRSSPTPLPPGVTIQATSDLARFVEGRLDLLVRNATYGGALVFATLLVFLNWRVALWVGVGLGLALLGTLVLMSVLDVTLNLLTMFGLIVVMGLLVDDAIVVAENIQARHDRGETAFDAAVHGTAQVGWPVVATVMTSVVAFAPLSFIRGQIGDLLGALPIVVACALLMSLIESLFILPGHLGHSLLRRDRARERSARPSRATRAVARFESARDGWVLGRLVPAYARLLGLALRARYVTLALTLAAFIAVMGLFAGDRVGFEFLPNDDAETVLVDLRMPIGTPLAVTERVVKTIEDAAFAEPEIDSVGSVVGQRANIDTGQAEAASTHVAQMFLELFPVEQRDRESSHVLASIRASLEGKLAGIDRIGFSEISGGPAGAAITLRVRGEDAQQVTAAVRDVKAAMGTLQGVVDIADDNDLGQAERRIVPRAADAAAVGLTPADIAAQVRAALFGIEAHTWADRREDIDVRVRLDADTRRDLGAVEGLWIVTPGGGSVPLTEVADIQAATTYATIRRVDRQRSVTVTADTLPDVSPEDISSALDTPSDTGPSPLDAIRAAHPRVEIVYAGRQEQMGKAFASLPLGMLAACLMIYVILAWLFGSYLQPILVMSIIPFSLVGVVLGHLALGYDMTFLSLIGMVALAGIVVNDSLILIEFYNLRRRAGRNHYDALLDAGRDRLRPILLTTITTVLGLMPLILEQSFQAKFLIPMGISIAMGLLSATFLILLTLPCLVLVLQDVKNLANWAWNGTPLPPPPGADAG